MRYSMGEDGFDASMLLYEQKDIKLDIEEIINTFAKKHPRKMIFFKSVVLAVFFVSCI